MMDIQKIKNILALIGYVTTLICISTTPHMVKWYLSMYVIYLVAIWLGHQDEEQK